MSEAKKAHWEQGKNGNLRDVVFLVPWNESNGIPLDRNMWIDCNSEENARLIAAAPDLLDALQRARSEIWSLLDSKGVHPKHARNWPEILAADSAIAKATGKTQ